MIIHYLQHDSGEGLGYIAHWADLNGVKVTRTLLPDHPMFPTMDEFDWLIILGGPMGAYEEGKYPWVVEEKAFIRQAIDHDKIVLGICLGSQLVANVLGARVKKNEEAEIGFFPVTFTESAQADSFFKIFSKEFMTVHWHGDTFELPEGSVLMASSKATFNQAFRWGNKVFAIQFHPEFTPGSIKDLLNSASSDLKQNGDWVQDEDLILKQLSVCEQNNVSLGLFLDEIMNRFS